MERVRLKQEPDNSPKARFSRVLNQEVIDDFCSYIMKGLPTDGVCDLLGISTGSFWQWMKKGERYLRGNLQPEEHFIHGRFVQEFRRASAGYRLKIIERLDRGGNMMWARDMTILERRDRRNFSRNAPPGGQDSSFDPDERFL